MIAQDEIICRLAEGKLQGLEEGREQGRAEGREQGRVEGLVEGREQGQKEVLSAIRSAGVSEEQIKAIELLLKKH